jgi:hypothetical protein
VLADLIPRDDSPGTGDQQGKHFEWLNLELHGCAALPQLTGLDIQLKVVKPKCDGRISSPAHLEASTGLLYEASAKTHLHLIPAPWPIDPTALTMISVRQSDSSEAIWR